MQGLFLADMRSAIWLQHSTSTLYHMTVRSLIAFLSQLKPHSVSINWFAWGSASSYNVFMLFASFRTAMTGKVHWEWSEVN